MTSTLQPNFDAIDLRLKTFQSMQRLMDDDAVEVDERLKLAQAYTKLRDELRRDAQALLDFCHDYGFTPRAYMRLYAIISAV